MPLSQQKIQKIKNQLNHLNITASDLEEQFILGSGKGGQKKNKTASCVRLTHKTAGLQVVCDQERLREDNRWLARRLLCEHYQKEILGLPTQKDIDIQKLKKQKKRRSRRSKIQLE